MCLIPPAQSLTYTDTTGPNAGNASLSSKEKKGHHRIEWLFWLKIQSQSNVKKHDNIYMYVLGVSFFRTSPIVFQVKPSKPCVNVTSIRETIHDNLQHGSFHPLYTLNNQGLFSSFKAQMFFLHFFSLCIIRSPGVSPTNDTHLRTTQVHDARARKPLGNSAHSTNASHPEGKNCQQVRQVCVCCAMGHGDPNILLC